MQILLAILLISWLVNSILFLPFIKFLYRLKFQRIKQKTLDAFNQRTPIFDHFHQKKAGTPVGGGLLIIATTSLMLPLALWFFQYFWVPVTSVYPLGSEIKIILFAFISFGLLGMFDDAKKTFLWAQGGFFGLRLRHKLFLEIFLAGIISYWLYTDLQIKIFYLPFFGVFELGWWYIPLSIFIIIGFANAFNIADGLDGLASGVLVIALFAFWIISASILDTVMSVFIAAWIGAVLAFLYFNIHPARIFLGDAGSLSFGATLAVVAMLLGKTPVLGIIGLVFILEALTSLIQLFSKKFFNKKIFAAAPLHLWLQYYGWSEVKIVMRFWILSIVLAVFGLLLTLIALPPPVVR